MITEFSKFDLGLISYAEKFPNQEVCGYISTEDEIVWVENTSKNPSDSFSGKFPDEYKAIVHSHPDGPYFPSETDMRQQIASAVPWGIIVPHPKHKTVIWFGDGVSYPIMDRTFVYGVTDCYSLLRDIYLVFYDLRLNEFPRRWAWWEGAKENLYLDNLVPEGFHQTNISDIQPGDPILFRIRSQVPNHVAVYIGDGLMVHHLCGNVPFDPTRKPKIEPVSRWLNMAPTVVTHEKDLSFRKISQEILTAI